MPAARRPPIIPPDQWRGLRWRLALVAGVGVLIGVVNAWMRPADAASGRRYDEALVYSMAVSLLTWLCIDVGRYLLRRPLRAQAPGYWPPPLRAGVFVALGIATGYFGGIAIGDAYAGTSSWAMLRLNPNRFTAILVSSLAVSGAFVAYFHERGRREALARQAREAELRLLQSQLEPHILFNTLANLRVLIGADPARAQAMLDRLIAFLRATLDASRTDRHTLAAEFDRVADYLALMQVRMGPRLQATLDLPDDLRGVPVPPMLLQPLVENAVKHGLEPAVEGGRIDVGARRDGHRLVLLVRDTGVGLRGEGPAGFGLQQVRDRLRALHGDGAALALRAAEGGGACAEVRLPLPAAA